MTKYILKRILVGIFSLFVLSAVTFFLTRAIPGSPFQNANVSDEVLTMLEKEYGLNEPVLVQYGTYLMNLLQGNLGYSYKDPSQSVWSVIMTALYPTLQIGGIAIVLAIVIGIPCGIWMASSKHTTVRGLLFAGSILGTGIPNFVVALVLMFVFGILLKLFPVAGLTSLRHYVLPSVSLAIYPASVISRMTAGLYEQESQKEYVIMARAKGMGWHKIVWSHILRHIWIPLLNYLGPVCAFLLTGSFVVESIFTIPGLGTQFVKSISNRDYTLIMGLTIFMGTVVIFIQLIVDLLGAVLDPRIRRSYDRNE